MELSFVFLWEKEPIRKQNIETNKPINTGSMDKDKIFAISTLIGAKITEIKAQRSLIFPGSHKAKVRGRKTTDPLKPIDKNPRSLIMVFGAKIVIMATESKIAPIIKRVNRSSFSEVFRLFIFFLAMSLSRIVAIPKDNPAPPPTTESSRVPRIRPPIKGEVWWMAKEGKAWMVLASTGRSGML